MSADYPSSNPFRRKGAPTAPIIPIASETPSISTSNHIAYQHANTPFKSSSIEQEDAPKKITKKVRVQSPPPLSPSVPDSASTIGEESYSIREKPPTPIPRDEDPFDSISSGSSDDNVAFEKPTQAPANPFSKTLETMEHPERGPALTSSSGLGKGSLDVDAFKRLLMTGSTGLEASPQPAAPPAHVTHALGDGGSSTDTSSVSRQSIFDALQEAHGESPRTSHEISEPEEERKGDFTSTAGRKKPPPPSSRHGKLIKMELRDDLAPGPAPPPVAVQSPNTPGSITSQSYFSQSPRSQTDLNKPLPPAPTRASHDSERESIFDKEAAGKTPGSPSPPASIRKKTPPAPPITRRHSQLVSDSKLTRGDSGRLSPKAEEENMGLRLDTGRPRSDSARAPPPPPSRRPGSIRHHSHQPPLTSPSTVSLPAPPPARGSSRHSTSGRPPSVKSVDISSNTPNKRSSVYPPPPPPPHRHGRASMDGASPGTSQRPSGEFRRSIEVMRRDSETSSILQVEKVDENRNPVSSPKHNVLADLDALQKEIDALRGQGVR